MFEKKIFSLFFILCFHKVFSTICDECVCKLNYKSDQDLGEYVDCSNRPYALKNSEPLPKTLYSLDLSMNNITDVVPPSLFRSKSMAELYLNNNNIKELNNVLELPELKLLDLSYNVLQFIHEDTLSNIRNLMYLNLANNRFKTFEKLTFHHLSNLHGIVLDYNDIGSSLREISLFDRGGFGLTTKIKNISIRGVNLNKVPNNFFVDAYDLKKLVISANNLTDIFEIPFTLEHLDLSDNPIASVSMEDFSDLPALKELKLNNLKIKEVPEYVFSQLHALVHLELERNRNLTEFSPLAFGQEVLDDADDFALEILSLKGSRLVTLDAKLTEPFGQLIKLNLQGNPWKCDCKIRWVKELRVEERERQEVRCGYPPTLYGKEMFTLEDKYFACQTIEHHVIGISIAVIFTCVILATVALWIFLFMPRYQSRAGYVRGLYAPTTAYAVLPLRLSEPVESRI